MKKSRKKSENGEGSSNEGAKARRRGEKSTDQSKQAGVASSK